MWQRRAPERRMIHRRAHTCSKEVKDDTNDLILRQLDIGILIQLFVLTVLNEAVCDVPDVALGGKGA